MMIRTLAEQALETALRHVDAAEVIAQHGETTSVSFENNRLKYVMTCAHTGLGVRVIHEGRIGFSYTTDFGDPEQVVRHALAGATYGQEAAFAFPGPSDAPELKVHDPAVRAFTVADGIDRCRGAIDRLLAYDDGLDCAAGSDATETTTCLLNSAGLAREITTTAFDIGAFALRVEDDGALTGVGEGTERRRLLPEMATHVDKMIDRLEKARRIAPLTAGPLPVVIDPATLDLLLSSIIANTSGKTRQKGTSRLIDREGEQVLDKCVTIWDDPHAAFAPGTAPFDGEGVPTRRRPLFENGVFRGFSYDLQTAGLLGEKPTGSGFRGYSSQPSCGHANIRVEPGETPVERLFNDIDRGVLVTEVLGGGQSNVLAGEFAVNIELGYLIENGEVVGRVKDAMLAGNAFDALGDVAAVSAETEWHGDTETPTVRFDNLSVVGSQT